MATKVSQKISQLNTELMNTIDELKNGQKTIDEANAIANLAGKIVGIMRVKIEYARARKEMPSVPFIED